MIRATFDEQLGMLMDRIDLLAAEAFVADERDGTRKYPRIVTALRDKAHLLDLEKHIGPVLQGADEEELVEAVVANLEWENGTVSIDAIRKAVRTPLITSEFAEEMAENLAKHLGTWSVEQIREMANG